VREDGRRRYKIENGSAFVGCVGCQKKPCGQQTVNPSRGDARRLKLGTEKRGRASRQKGYTNSRDPNIGERILLLMVV
jgi:hypothetical protein